MGAKAPQDYALQPAQTRYGSGGVERLAGQLPIAPRLR
jgi:hypothetical protein